MRLIISRDIQLHWFMNLCKRMKPIGNFYEMFVKWLHEGMPVYGYVDIYMVVLFTLWTIFEVTMNLSIWKGIFRSVSRKGMYGSMK